MTGDQARQPRPAARAAPATAQTLSAAAARYVARYAASTAQLRRVLQRRVQRAGMVGADVDPDAAQLIEKLIERMLAIGALDDRAFAQRRVAGLRLRGESQRRITQRLAAAGIDRERSRAAMDAALPESGDDNSAAAELAAAIRFAKRRRLGPYRDRDRRELRQRDFATMARAGFDMDVVRRVVDAEDAGELECQ